MATTPSSSRTSKKTTTTISGGDGTGRGGCATGPPPPPPCMHHRENRDPDFVYGALMRNASCDGRWDAGTDDIDVALPKRSYNRQSQ